MKTGFVSLIGRPNAGKSTLLNRLVGTKLAIVSEKPQTTRTRILGVRNYPEGQAIFIDTPGIHRPLHRMNVRMVDAAVESMAQADVVGLVTDSHASAGKGDRFVLDLLDRVKAPVVLILNKIDLISKPSLLPLIDSYRRLHEFADIVPVSGLTGDNVDRLERVLLDRLPESEPLYPSDTLTDQPEQFFAAEMVREQVLAYTHDELPFTTAVVVDQFEETAPSGDEERGLLRIFCSILVERSSQKPIVVGRRGHGIKQIGTAARLELERFFGARVYLDLRVKVREGWREDARALNGIGIRGSR